MTKVTKITNDAESKRFQKNKTETQIKNANNIKEGKIVNAFVKDPNLSLDETLDTLVISRKEVNLPNKVFEREESQDKRLIYLAIASTSIMALLGGFTAMIKNFSKKKFESSQEYLLPGITRNHCINDEIHQSIFSMIQSPNRKTILAALGVITLGAMAFIGKNFVDGFKEIWVKQQEADIQKNLQENLIEVETQSFSGKIQIIRSLLSQKAKLFTDSLNETNPNFKGKNSEKDSKEKTFSLTYAGIGFSTLLTILGLGYFALKNIRKSEELIKKGLENTRIGLENLIKEFNEGAKINPIEGHKGEILKDKDAYKHLIVNMMESLFVKPKEIEEYVNKMNLSDSEKEEFIKHLKSSMNQATEKVNNAMGGSGRNKITYFSHVNDYLSFFYDWLMNPKNPQFKNLFLGISSISALSYCGKTLTDAIKEVQVKKYGANIELDLQKRLVSTELRNFKAKKESAIEPLCEEFFEQKKQGKSPEELKVIADNILFEVKNGPPFVYS